MAGAQGVGRKDTSFGQYLHAGAFRGNFEVAAMGAGKAGHFPAQLEQLSQTASLLRSAASQPPPLRPLRPGSPPPDPGSGRTVVFTETPVVTEFNLIRLRVEDVRSAALKRGVQSKGER